MYYLFVGLQHTHTHIHVHTHAYSMNASLGFYMIHLKLQLEAVQSSGRPRSLPDMGGSQIGVQLPEAPRIQELQWTWVPYLGLYWGTVLNYKRDSYVHC